MDWALQVIRATRADPPGKANKGSRRALYGASLQQFDELIEASRTAGHASRPLSLFYALSQAGRAIVAAHGSSNRIGSHGLAEDRSVRNLDVLERAVVRRQSNDDAFTAVCEALRLPDPFGTSNVQSPSIPLGAVWAALPRWHVYLPEWNETWFPALRAFNKGGDGRDHMDRRVMQLQGSKQSPQVAAGFDPLASGIYPQLPASAWYEPNAKHREVAFSNRLRLGTMRWEQDSDERSVFDVTRTLHDDDIERWLLPAAAGSDQAFEPITAWWILLFGMSILARYDPALWSAALELDKSDRAVPLRLILDEALAAVPALVADALLSEVEDHEDAA